MDSLRDDANSRVVRPNPPARLRSLSKSKSVPAIKLTGGALRLQVPKPVISPPPTPKPRILNKALCASCASDTDPSNPTLDALLSHWPAFVADLTHGRRLYTHLQAHPSPSHTGRDSAAWHAYLNEGQVMDMKGFMEMVIPHSDVVVEDVPYENHLACLRCTLWRFCELYWQGAWMGRQLVRLDDRLVECRGGGPVENEFPREHLFDLKKDLRIMRKKGWI